MSKWTKRQRFETIMSGKPGDRPLVTAWRHFVGREDHAEALAAATIEFQQTYDWDFVKINPRATYYSEVWGNTHDYGEYDVVLPKLTNYVVHDASNLGQINASTRNKDPLNEQLKAIRLIRQGLGQDIPLIQTLFSPLSVLFFLSGHNPYPGAIPPVERASSTFRQLIAHDRSGVHAALKEIAHTLAEYAQAAVEAGSDGIFYSLFGFANNNILSEEEFAEFSRPYDLIILEALNQGYTVLHTCGPESNPERFVDYPIHAIHWANQANGNPTLASSKEWIGAKAAVGGVSEHLFGTTQTAEIQAQAAQAIDALRERPFILTAGCGLPVSTTDEALRALRESID